MAIKHVEKKQKTKNKEKKNNHAISNFLIIETRLSIHETNKKKTKYTYLYVTFTSLSLVI